MTVKMVVSSTVLVLIACVTLTFALEHEETQSEIQVVNECKNEDDTASICLQCASLPFEVGISFDTCCGESAAFMFCKACTDDSEACNTLMQEIDDLDTIYTDYSDVDDDVIYDDDDGYYDNEDIPKEVNVEKRYGKLFMANPKRFGKIFFGKRDSGMNIDNLDKRFGRLYMGSGSYFGKRSPVDKRFGRLYMGSGSYFGKRSDVDDGVAIGDDSDMADIDKRYGRIFFGKPSSSRRFKLFGKRDSASSDSTESGETMDKRYGRLFTSGRYKFGKRDFSSPSIGLVDSELAPLDKRYGSLFVSKFGKRGDSMDEDSATDVDKRFGRLYMNKMRLFSRPPKRAAVDKRFGRLFTSRRKYYFGK